MKKGVIFCVDDEKIVLNSLKTELKNAIGNDYIIETAESGIEALEAIESLIELNYEILVVIADYAMPIMKGDEFLTELHEKSPSTLNILLTGQATVEGIANSINYADLYRYISKPWHTNDLILTVNQAVKSYHQENQIKIQNKELTELSSSLENKVQLRTQELKNKNSLLLEKQKEITIQNEELENYRNHLENLVEERTLELTMEKDKAQESERLKSAFLANMSHEIRTPMSGILGFTELLKEPLLLKEKQQKYLEIIKKSGERLLNIINEIIDISKIEAGIVKSLDLEINVNNKIDYLYTFFKTETEKKKLEFFCKKTLSNEQAVIKTDGGKLDAILINLIKNTIKYTDYGCIEFGYNLNKESDSNLLEFYVRDTGIGIPKDRQQAIFDLFVQADIEDKNAMQGAGLGLSITKAYVEMMNGKIWVESEEGKGSIFYFTIPYCPVNLIVKKEVLISNSSLNLNNKLKILIVEDDESAKQYLSIILESFSKNTLLAGNGKEAVEICKNNLDIDLVLMDIKMPVMNGFDATREIRLFNKDVIIIAQSAYALFGDKEKTLESGCNDYISKPISKKQLTTIILKYFSL
ncbi:response regulator [Lutibacter citreus]|uniref:response regulator n=1 Tax=Lutibacter citreus TaxID=2138210 RepID=UPI000DBE5E07|nr:response regulator [Lutibacter citreus]